MSDPSDLYRSRAGYELCRAHTRHLLARWPVEPASQWVETRAGRTHILSLGDAAAPPLVLLHGWGDNAGGWVRHLDLARLSRHFHLIAPDIVGQTGRSAATRLASVAESAAWLIDVLDQLQLAQANMLGLMAGAHIALATAAHSLDRLTRLCLVTPAGIHPPGSVWFYTRAFPYLLWPSEARLRRYYRVMSAGRLPDDLIHELANETLLWRRHYRPQPPIPRLNDLNLRAVQGRTLILLGAEDRINHSVLLLHRAQRFIGDLTCRVIPSSGYYLSLEYPDLITEEVLGFCLT